ncbi:MAG: YbcC family protein [Bacteroidota bacterium]
MNPMEHQHTGLDATIHDLKHYLPAQASLKDFIHHNTLHSFQQDKFFEGIRKASAILGYKVSLSLAEYREFHRLGKISDLAIARVLQEYEDPSHEWLVREEMLSGTFEPTALPRIGRLRSLWKSHYKLDVDSLVHPVLFRVLCSFLDQGISVWNFPLGHLEFMEAVREMERLSSVSFFRTSRARTMLLEGDQDLSALLSKLVGDPALHARYLFDQQFTHQGWSGIVSVVEDFPDTLLDRRKISLKSLIHFELLLELDAVWSVRGDNWQPLSELALDLKEELFAPVPETRLHRILMYWQEAFERTYHDQVLKGILDLKEAKRYSGPHSMQGLFCIDDRECSFRRYVEEIDPRAQTFGTPGFFGVEFYFQPEDGKFLTKLCPAPVTPKYLIRESKSTLKRLPEYHFQKSTHGLFRAWIITQTLGFWAAVKLFLNIFRPSMSPATASSFRHMDKHAELTIEHTGTEEPYNGLQVGFTKPEMASRVEALLKSIGLVRDFAPLVYVIGHGSSSVNNPHYAAYDCGACSGRAGSVNARVLCHMANDAGVRELLRARGLDIPDRTRFIGGLHDTTRDEIVFFDDDSMTVVQAALHRINEQVFQQALDLNARERSRRFVSVETHRAAGEVHEDILIRSVSLFEPRPELNHATNALCIVGKRSLTDGLFMDRRVFMNSYDPAIDPEGNLLLGIIRPIPPVCGGINLEYYFSRVDNQKLGAGTKLPHNVMGLFGVANGIDGDLRPGLPSQMIEVHDPVRLMVIVQQSPDLILKTLQRSPETYDWFLKDWVLLVSVHPDTRELMKFRDGVFRPYTPSCVSIPMTSDLVALIGSTEENIPVHLITEQP